MTDRFKWTSRDFTETIAIAIKPGELPPVAKYDMQGQERPFIIAILALASLFITIMACSAQSLETLAETKIDTLETLISEAELAGIDCLKEKLTIRTAEVFLKYANWDENNIAENTGYFELVNIYQDHAVQMAEDLADWERNDLIKMLEEATAYLQRLVDGEITRKPTPDIDWEEIIVDGDQLTYNNRPVFIADYTWKPEVTKLTRFHGNQDGFYVSPSHIIDDEGTINSWVLSDLNSKPDGTLGFIFFNNKNVPQWTLEKYGAEFSMREDTYTAYDIDNPGAREMQELIIEGFVPTMAGKKYTELGYMLCNEPHFYTSIDGDKELWASGPVSEYTKEKFRAWLKNKHENISELNALWETSFENFDSVEIMIPIDIALRGTAKWYDWVCFNNERVTDWYTFVKGEILKHDPNAKVHLKIMPNLWSENNRNHGIDLEALTALSGIIGNDAGSENSRMWGEIPWADHYAYMWRELFMSYDFMKSVSPGKIIFNSENHFLSTGKFRDLYNDPMYVRSVFWAATTLGLNASQIWYWPRAVDGSLSRDPGTGYAGSNNQQPRITNEVHSTLMDLNSFAEEITAMQKQARPLRIFYSETSAINKRYHMDAVFELYESLNFEGLSLGFATEDIIKEQDNKLWEAILIYKTQFVTQSELDALQGYLDQGGTIIMDASSLLKNEYGVPHTSLEQGNGTIIATTNYSDIREKALTLLEEKQMLPPLKITETNTGGHAGCTWKCIETDSGTHILSMTNMGKTAASLEISLRDSLAPLLYKDLLTGTLLSSTPTLQPYEVFFVEVSRDYRDTTSIDTTENNQIFFNTGSLYPNPSDGAFIIEFPEMHKNIDMRIYNINGRSVLNRKYTDVSSISSAISEHPDGLYFIELLADTGSSWFKFLKQAL